MGRFDDGVSGYLKATATVTTYFPIDRKGNVEVYCEACNFYRTSSRRCGLTNEVVPYPTKYVGRECPLEPVEEKKEET